MFKHWLLLICYLSQLIKDLFLLLLLIYSCPLISQPCHCFPISHQPLPCHYQVVFVTSLHSHCHVEEYFKDCHCCHYLVNSKIKLLFMPIIKRSSHILLISSCQFVQLLGQFTIIRMSLSCTLV